MCVEPFPRIRSSIAGATIALAAAGDVKLHLPAGGGGALSPLLVSLKDNHVTMWPCDHVTK